MRSHPPTLLTLTRRAVVQHSLFGRGSRVLVAVSGGPDSMALLHALALLRDKLGHDLVAHGVDHGLRPAAALELDLAEAFAREHAVPFARSVLAVARGGNLQARAREARYAALRAAASTAGVHVIATAHHADDRAETLLLRLLRGAGPTGLAVLPPQAADSDLVRPFTAARRADILAHLARHRVPFASDPSNLDPRFLRTQVRTRVLPLLEELSPSIVAHLTTLADQLAALPSDPFAGIARETRAQLLALARGDAPRAEVRLGGDLVVRRDRTHAEGVRLDMEPMNRSQRAHDRRASREPLTLPRRSTIPKDPM